MHPSFEPAPSYGMGFVDQGLAVASRHEGAFDIPDQDKGKEETSIDWAEPRIDVQAGSSGASPEGRAKRQSVSFGSATCSSANVNGPSTCVEKPFTVAYTNVTKKTDRKLKVSSISGGATIKVNYGGSRNAIANPPPPARPRPPRPRPT